MSDDECPDFDDTLRAMLATPPNPRQRTPADEQDDTEEAHENTDEPPE